MKRFIVKTLITALGLALAAIVVPGIRIDSFGTLFFAALLLGVVNAVIRPVLLILTLPVTVVTLGLFILVINALMLALVAGFLPGFFISSFSAAFLGWVIVWITSLIAEL